MPMLPIRASMVLLVALWCLKNLLVELTWWSAWRQGSATHGHVTDTGGCLAWLLWALRSQTMPRNQSPETRADSRAQ